MILTVLIISCLNLTLLLGGFVAMAVVTARKKTVTAKMKTQLVAALANSAKKTAADREADD